MVGMHEGTGCTVPPQHNCISVPGIRPRSVSIDMSNMVMLAGTVVGNVVACMCASVAGVAELNHGNRQGVEKRQHDATDPQGAATVTTRCLVKPHKH